MFLYRRNQHHIVTSNNMMEIDTTNSSSNRIDSSDPLRRKSSTSAKVSGHDHQRQIGNIPIGGNVLVPVLLVRFKGHESRSLPSRDYFDELFNGNGISTTNPAGSIRQYFRYASLGTYNVTFDVHDWYQLSKTEEEYSGGVSGYDVPNVDFEQMWIPKLNARENRESLTIYNRPYVSALTRFYRALS